jgi:thioesterase domain-containing protein
MPFRTKGGLSPVFLVHPIGGLSWCYSRLLPYLPKEHPVYGLQASGYLREDRMPGSVAEMAQDYLAHIRRIVPSGPFILVGWSFGGVVAQEAAAAEEEAGRQAPLLVLLDSGPALRTGPESVDPATDEVLRLVTEAVGGAVSDFAPSSGAELAQVATHCLRILAEHDSRAFGGRIFSIEATGSAEIRRRARRHWSDLAGNGTETHSVDCAHTEMLDPVSVERIGPLIAEFLSRSPIRSTNQ